MPPPRTPYRPPQPRLPVRTVRDLLGLTRALYGVWLAAGAPPERLEALREVGESYRLSLEQALRVPDPDTMGHRAAVSRAEDATRRLGELVAQHDASAAALVAAAGGRVLALRRR